MMAALSLFILSLLALYLVCLARTQATVLRVSVALLLVLVVLASLCLDGWRWPRAALWLWVLALGGCLLVRSRTAAAGAGRSRPRWLFACGACISWCALNLAQQSVASLTLPALSGPYPVSQHQWTVQSQRQDLHSPDPFARREFLVNVYYPTLVNGAIQRAPYLSEPMMRATFFQHAPLLQRFFFEREVMRLRSQSWEGMGSGLSPVQAKYPIVIFSPGLGWFAAMHTFYLEQLASQGYVVFAITHPGDSDLVEFPDGRQVRGGWSAGAPVEDEGTSNRRQAQEAQLHETLEQLLATGGTPSQAQLRALQAPNTSPTRDHPLAVRRDDVVDLLDRLAALNSGSPVSQFAGRLDMDNIAVTGMSYGGPTASDVCLQDQRCKVVVNLDGEEFGRLPLETNTRPALWLYRMDRWQGAFLRRIAFERYAGPAYRVGFTGARHATFSDQPFWPPEVDLWGMLLPRWLWDDSSRQEQALPPLILAYELDFLDHYLKGRQLRLLRSAQARSGVAISLKNASDLP